MNKNPIIKQVLHYLSGNVVAKVVQFISLLLFTRILSPTDYGIFSIFIGYAAVFTLLLTLNSHTAVSRYYYESNNDFEQFTGTTIISTLILLIISSFILLLNLDVISKIIQIKPVFVVLFIPVAIIEFVTVIYIQILQPIRKTKEIAILLILKSFLSLICSLSFALALKNEKLNAIIYGYVFGNFLALIYAGTRNKKMINLTFKFSHLRYIFSYSLPLIIYSLTTIVLTQSDKLMIAKLSGADNAGLYSLASNISMIVAVFFGAILSAWTPNYYEGLNNGDYKTLKNQVTKIFYISTLLAIFFGLFGAEIGLLL